MRKLGWKPWAVALSSFCALTSLEPLPIVHAADTAIEKQEGGLEQIGRNVGDLITSVSDFYEQFCDFVAMETQIWATPLFEPYTVHTVSGASRGGNEKEAAFLPQPAPGSTLLAGHSTRFAWNKGNHPKKFRIKESESGKVIYEQDIANVTSLSIVPKEVGMKYTRAYFWELDEDSNSIRREMRLLDADLEKDLEKRLLGLTDLDTYEDIHWQVLQAAYLITWSDHTSNNADLHWLALELLMKPEMKELRDETSVKMREVLLDACRRHLDSRLP